MFAVLAVATLLLSIAAAGRGAVPGDRAVARWLQANPIPYGDPVAAVFNEGIGGHSLTVAALLMAASLLFVRQRQATILLAAAAGLRLSNGLLKEIIDSSRPTPGDVTVTERVATRGFPSGHVMSATLVLGALAYLAATEVRRGWLRALLVALCCGGIVLTGYSRVHTGAHWPSDVLGGWLWGATLLMALIWTVQRVDDRLRARRPPVVQ